jgi:hypothetical protein
MDVWESAMLVSVAMIELVVTTTVTAGSALLFAYWFRYAGLLIHSRRLEQALIHDYAVIRSLLNRAA